MLTLCFALFTILRAHIFTCTEIDNAQLEEFLERLDLFRPDAEIFLKMLNDMRRRLKELPQNSPAAQQYRSDGKIVTFRVLWIWLL